MVLTEGIQENLLNKLKKDNPYIENDNEYYYIVGQCTRYMASKYVKMFMQGKIRENQVVKFILQSKDNEQLRKNLKTMLIGKCSNIIYLDKDKKFNNAFAMLMGYIAVNKEINRDYLDIGYCSNNVLH